MTWNQLSRHLADVIDGIAAHLVAVQGRRRGPSTGVAWTEDLIVTANHTLHRNGSYPVLLPDGTTVTATLVGRDRRTDLAVLKVEEGGLSPLPREEQTLRVGHLVVTAGRRPRGVKATLGMVSAAGDAWRTHHGGQIDQYVEVDAELPRGFSGGPLLNLDGKAVGLNTSALTRRGAVLPVKTVERVVKQLVEHGSTAGGYLGVGFFPTEVEGAARVVAVSVEPEGPSDGIFAVGDVLVSLAGEAVTDIHALMGVLGSQVPGNTVKAQVLRAGTETALEVTLGERPKREHRRHGRHRHRGHGHHGH